MLYELERKSMEQLDIPYFTSDKKWRMNNDDTDEDFIFFNRKRDSTVLIENLNKMGMKDYSLQKKIIEKAISRRFKS